MTLRSMQGWLLWAWAGLVALSLTGCPSSTGPDLIGCDCMCTFSGSFASVPAFFPVGRACGIATGTSQNVGAACNRICRRKDGFTCLTGPLATCPTASDKTCSALTTSAPQQLPLGELPTSGGSFQANGCPGSRAAPPSEEGGEVGATTAAVLPGSVLSFVSAGNTTVPVTGYAQVTTGGGEFVLTDLALTSSDVQQVQGKRVSSGGTLLSSPARGVFGSPARYAIPAGNARLLITAVIDGSQVSLRGSNTTELTGDYDESSGLFTMDGQIQDSAADVTVQANLILAFQNRPPFARISAPAIAECNAPGTAVVRVSAAASTDPDGEVDIAQYLWILDRGAPGEAVFSGVEFDLPLSLGEHELQLFVRDRTGSMTGTRTRIEARDTTGPVLQGMSITPACLWPPNHKLAHYQIGRNVLFAARDVCAPGSEHVRVVRITSSEAPDGLGDGSTSPDGVTTGDGFCLRAERSGLSPVGREYGVEFEAVDSSGNRSLTTSTVSAGVAHDQRGTKCESLGVELVDDGDPLCIPAQANTAVVVGQPVHVQERPHTQGCSSVMAVPGLAGWAAVLVMARRRRS